MVAAESPPEGSPTDPAPDAPDATTESDPDGNGGPAELTDAEFGRLFGRGAAVGIPVLFLILAALTMLAVPEHPEVLIAILLPALLAGWYFGGFGALAITELRHERRKK